MIPAQVPPASPSIAAAPPLRSGSPGAASLVIAITVIVLGMAVQVLTFSTPMILRALAVSANQTAVVFGLIGLVMTVIALIGVVLGAIGVQPGRDRRLVAAAGFAVCLAQSIGGTFSLVMPPLVGLLYR